MEEPVRYEGEFEGLKIQDWVSIRAKYKKGTQSMLGRIQNIFPETKEMLIDMGGLGHIYLTVPIHHFKKVED